MRRILISLILAAALVLAWTPWADRAADRYTSQSLAGAAVAFAVARSLNGVISLLQDSEVNAGVGVSGTIAVGEILDPLNDMVERFSEVAFTAVVALSFQKLLIAVVGHAAVNVLLTVSVALLAVLIWRPGWLPGMPRIVIRGAMVLIALRFGMVVIAGLNQGFYELFLDERYRQAAEGLKAVAEETAEETGTPVPEAARGEGGLAALWASVKEQARRLTDLEGLVDRLERAIDYMTTMILVFVVNAMLLPVLLLWAFLKLVGSLWQTDPAWPGASAPRGGTPPEG